MKRTIVLFAVILVFIGYASLKSQNIQQRLNNGETPFQIYFSNKSLLDSLYGKTYQGGLIAYLNTTDGSGIIAAPTDQPASQWGCARTRRGYNGAWGEAIGTGKSNTDQVAKICRNGAQYYCKSLTLNGFRDWFLPSKNELSALYSSLFLRNIGGFASNGYYWSSTYGGNEDFNPSYQFVPGGATPFEIYTPPQANLNIRAIRYIPAAQKPSVKTLPINTIGADSLTTGLTVSDGGAILTKVGLCYSTNPMPDTSKTKVLVNNKSGKYSISISGLQPNTRYYLTAFAVNQLGISFGTTDTADIPAMLPVVSTGPAYVAADTAVCSGNISSNGGADITVAGICYSTSATPAPSLQDNVVNSNVLTDTFSVTLNNLLPVTKYYFRTFATNSEGTAYGLVQNFTTSVYMPMVATTSVNNITSSSVIVQGNVTSDGGAQVTDRGVCYNTTGNPTVNDSKVSSGNGVGSFSSTLSNLSINTQYFVRTYATNSAGTSYGVQMKFTTQVNIGDQYQGGIVFYILKPGDPGYDANVIHGIVAAPEDLPLVYNWAVPDSCGSTAPTPNDTTIGSGKSNTAPIAQVCTRNISAAGGCLDWRVQQAGDFYNDWYLPSKKELNEMRKYKELLKMYGYIKSQGTMYWSSSIADWNAKTAWAQSFYVGVEGYQQANKMDELWSVRPIRYF